LNVHTLQSQVLLDVSFVCSVKNSTVVGAELNLSKVFISDSVFSNTDIEFMRSLLHISQFKLFKPLSKVQIKQRQLFCI
jgi:hypothetical protein